MTSLKWVWWLLVVFFIGKNVYGQSQVFLTPFIGYEFGTPHSISRSPGLLNIDQFNTEGHGSSVNHSVLLGLELSFPHLFSDYLGIGLRGSFIHSDGHFISDPYGSTTSSVHLQSGLPLFSENTFRVSATESQGRFALFGTLDKSLFSLAVGAWIGYRFASNVSLTESIVSPSNAVFADSTGRFRELATGDQLTSFAWRFGGLTHLVYRIELTPSLALAPFVGIDFDAEALFDELIGIRALSFNSGLGFRFNLAPGETKNFIRDSLRFISVPSTLSAIVDIYNADVQSNESDTATLIVNRTVQRRYIPIPSVLSFDVDDLFSWRERDELMFQDSIPFEQGRISRWSIPEIVTHIPDIIGMRLRENPTATIVLTELYDSLRSSSGEKSIGFDYRRHLIELWGIDSTRVLLKKSVQGGQKGIHLEASESTILAPLSDQREVEDITPAKIGMRKKISAISKHYDWKIDLRQGDRSIGRFDSTMNMFEIPIEPDAFTEADSVISLTAELVVTNSDGDTAVDSDRLSVVQVNEQSTEIASYLFLNPEVDATLSTVNQAFIHLIASRANDKTILHIEGAASTEGHPFTKENIVQAILEKLDERSIQLDQILITTTDSVSLPTPFSDGIVVTVESIIDEF